MTSIASQAQAETATPLPRLAEGLTDAEVMLRVKVGDESAFEYLVQKYRRAMRKRCSYGSTARARVTKLAPSSQPGCIALRPIWR